MSFLNKKRLKLTDHGDLAYRMYRRDERVRRSIIGNEIISDYVSGVDLQIICSKFNVPISYIEKLASKYVCGPHLPTTTSQPLNEAVGELASDVSPSLRRHIFVLHALRRGHSLEELSTILNVGGQQIRNLLSKAMRYERRALHRYDTLSLLLLSQYDRYWSSEITYNQKYLFFDDFPDNAFVDFTFDCGVNIGKRYLMPVASYWYGLKRFEYDPNFHDEHALVRSWYERRWFY